MEQHEGQTEHIAPLALAALADPMGPGWSDPRATAHLAGCRHCMAVYAEFARAHAAHAVHAVAPEADPAPEHWLEMARAIATPEDIPWRRGGNRRRGMAAAALVAAAASVALVMWRGGWVERRPDVAPQTQQRISEKLREDSNGALLYARTLMPRSPGTRGVEAARGALDLAPLMESFVTDASSPEVAYWLIAGLLATDQQRHADQYLGPALLRFPSDARFRNLAAILAYKRSELGTAERELREALVLEQRSDLHLYNLALVLHELGRDSDAAPLLAEILSRFPGEPIADLVTQRTARSGLRGGR